VSDEIKNLNEGRERESKLVKERKGVVFLGPEIRNAQSKKGGYVDPFSLVPSDWNRKIVEG